MWIKSQKVIKRRKIIKIIRKSRKRIKNETISIKMIKIEDFSESNNKINKLIIKVVTLIKISKNSFTTLNSHIANKI